MSCRPGDVLTLVNARRGHFRYESGYHGDLWFDLDPLFARPGLLQPYTKDLAARLSQYKPEVVCGPLVGGAYLALMIATDLGIDFCYTKRRILQGDVAQGGEVRYDVPDAMHRMLHQRRVAIVDDAINAGSAVQGTLDDIRRCGAKVVAIGALIALGTAPAALADREGVSLEATELIPNLLWIGEECPLCAAGVPLDR